MPPPLARLMDMHFCPMQTPVPMAGLVPHVGGPILGPGAPLATLGGVPLACVGDTCFCALIPSTIITGSVTGLIFGRPAARFGDLTAHGGYISLVSPFSL